MRALSLLENVGISVMKSLNDDIQDLNKILGPILGISSNATSLLLRWSKNTELDCFPPTWENLLFIIYFLHLDNLYWKVDTYLKRESMEQYSEIRSKINVVEGLMHIHHCMLMHALLNTVY